MLRLRALLLLVDFMFNARVALACSDGHRFESIAQFRGELARAMTSHMSGLPVDMSLWDIEEGLRKRGWLYETRTVDHSGDECTYLIFKIPVVMSPPTLRLF